MKNKKIVLIVVVCLVVAGLSFFGGVKYASSKNPSSQFANRGQNGFPQNQNGDMKNGGNFGSRGGMVAGEILTMDNTGVTVKLTDGGSKIVFISPSTKIEKTVDGVIADLAVGKQVSIIGASNSDGSVNATSVQLRSIPVVNK